MNDKLALCIALLWIAWIWVSGDLVESYTESRKKRERER